jgi:hypothetical protein
LTWYEKLFIVQFTLRRITLKTILDLPQDGTLGTIELTQEDGTKTYLVGFLGPKGPEVVFAGQRKLAFSTESTAVHVAAFFNTVNRLGGLQSLRYDALYAVKPQAEEIKNEELSTKQD